MGQFSNRSIINFMKNKQRVPVFQMRDAYNCIITKPYVTLKKIKKMGHALYPRSVTSDLAIIKADDFDAVNMREVAAGSTECSSAANCL